MSRRKNVALFATGILAGALLTVPTARAAGAYLKAFPSSQEVILDGESVRIQAYNIEGNNFVKLRDIGEAAGFNVWWDGRNIQIYTNEPYTGIAPTTAPRGLTHNPDGYINIPADGSRYIPQAGDVIRCDDGSSAAYLMVNGAVQPFNYVYYNYASPTGFVKEIPAYCVNPNTDGVTQVVGPGESVAYLAEERASDPRLTGIVASGYPTRGLQELGVDTKEQAYYATKIALWCYLIGSWDINNVKVNPNLTGADLEAANKVLAAAKDIYRRGSWWEENPVATLTTLVDRSTAYPVTIDGIEYLQQIITVDSATWISDYTVHVSFADPAGVPAGTRIVDMNNNDITTITTSYDEAVYAGQCKILIPANSVEGQTGNIRLNFRCDVYQYAVYYAVCAEESEYGTLQDYLCDTDPARTIEATAFAHYSDDAGTPEDPDTPDEPDAPDAPNTPETGLKIRKVSAGTREPLEGAVFEIIGPDGDVYGLFSSDRNGSILLDLTLSGTYVVTEKHPPKGHLPAKEPTKTVTVAYGEVAEVVFENEPYGNLRVEKVDADSGGGLPGARIQIMHVETGEVRTEKTNPAGVAQFDGLKSGAWEISEIVSPDGYLLDRAVYTTNVVTGETVSFTLTNQAKPGLRIVKYDRKNMIRVPDVTFEVFRDGISLGKFTTDRQGEIVLKNIQPGTYRAVEVDTGNDGLILDSTPQEIELSAGDGIRELIFFNDTKPGMWLVKVDSADPSKTIPNAVFEICTADGSFGPEEFTTDQNGEIDLSHLPIGAYVVTEKECAGYVIDDAQRIIHLDPNETAQFVFTNSALPTLRLLKVSTDGNPLSGVSFRISKVEDGTHYLDRITNQHGEIEISSLEPGVYSVKEIYSREDHVPDLREHKVELFPGKTSTIVLENHCRPGLIIHKRDADTGVPVPNTVFLVAAADGHSVTRVETDGSGKARVENLLPGVYEVTEESVPEPYLADGGSQLVTLHPNRDHEIWFENHKKPTVTILKEDSITGEPLKGAKFRLTWRSNKTTTGELRDLGTHITDEHGKIVLEGLEDGWLTVTETEPPTGYAIKSPATQEVYIHGGEQRTLRFQNHPLSALIVWKFDSVTGEAIEGAIFQVRYLDGGSGIGGTVIGKYKTGPGGAFTVTGLKAGAYVVEELASDTGHVIDTAPQTVSITEDEQAVVQLYFGNAPKGDLLVKKLDSTTGKPLSGVEFQVTDSDGTVIGKSNGKFVTGSDGSFLVSDIVPGTTLIVTETKARDGYLKDDTPQTITIRPGQTMTLEFHNQPKGGLVILKTDSVTGEPLAGAEFKVTTSNGIPVVGEGNDLGIYVTDSEGKISIPHLSPDTYIITETKTLSTHLMDSPPQTVALEAGETKTVTFTNTPKGGLVIKKIDSVTREPIEGVEVAVTGPTGTTIHTTNADGLVRLLNLPSGQYTIVEEKAREGYACR